MKKRYSIVIAIIIVFLIGCVVWYKTMHIQQFIPGASTNTNHTVEYKNDQYGFIFTLPNDWQGYSIVQQTWTGYINCSSGQCPGQTGPELSIRNPKWTTETPYQDIPILIFTHSQWNDVLSGNLITSAAPIPPTKFGENTQYVFALPARYNYAFPEGWQEVETIIEGNPLKTQ